MFPAQEELCEMIVSQLDSVDDILMQAAGYPEQLSQILNDNKHYQIREELFTTVISNLGNPERAREYEKSFYLLLESIPKKEIVRYVNARDKDKKIPLEYIAEFQKSLEGVDCSIDDIMKKLLDEGASLAEKDSSDKPVINQLTYEKVRGYLDGCVQKGKYGNMDFDFKNILPWGVPEGMENVDVLGFLIHINSSYLLRALMAHQVVVMFLIYVSHLKWESHRGIFYANSCFFLIFYSSVCVQVVESYYPMNWSWSFLLVTTILLAGRELFQFLIAHDLYIRTAENYLEVVIIALVITASSLQDKSISDQLVVFVFLFSTFDLLLQIGKHIRLIRYIQLFKAVLKIFAKLSFFIMIIIIAFAISFNVLFNEEAPFTTPAISIFKTIIMVTGEYDSSSLDFTKYPVGSHLILLFFIIIVSIVLMNLILGLAVSDIQNMEQNSKLRGFISNIEFFHQVETLLLKPKAKVIFDYLGRIHESLNLSTKCTRNNAILWDPLIVYPQSPYFVFTSKVAEQEDKGHIREAVWKLTQMVEKLDVKMTSLQNEIAQLRL